MAITKRPPRTIYLGGGLPGGDGGITYVNDLVAIEILTPGMIVEGHNDGGVEKWGVHDVADDPCPSSVVLENLMMNKTIDDTYAAGDLVIVGVMRLGSTFLAIVGTGLTINPGDLLQSAGNGKLKPAATGDIRFKALEGTGGATVGDTRLRVEVIK